MDRMENARAVFFLEDDSVDVSIRPLMLQPVLFCPILSWLRQQLRGEGVERFFVWLPETMDTWKAEAEACFAPEDDVTVSCDRAALRDFLQGEGKVTVFPDAEIPVRLEGRGYAYRAEAAALLEGWFEHPDSSEVRGWEPYGGSTPILSLEDLQAQEMSVRDIILARHLSNGVRILDPAAVYIDPRVEIGAGTLILPGTILRGKTTIGRDCEIGPNTMIRDCTLGDGCVANSSQLNEAVFGANVNIGPFAYVRPGTRVADNAKVGDFVEVKNAVIGEGTKLPHLIYVGDSDVGAHCNFGCGSITCNYDGNYKYRTTVGDDAFIGCNTNLVSPCQVGDGAYTAAGTTITGRIPADALAIGRVEPATKPGWARRHRAKKTDP